MSLAREALRMAAAANAFAILPNQTLEGLPTAYQPDEVAKSLRRASKVDRTKIKAARKQNRKRK